FPKFEGEPIRREPGPAALAPPIDHVHPECGIKFYRAIEVRDLENHLEHAQYARPPSIRFTEFDAVPLRIVKIQRARAPEGVFVEVEIGRQPVVPCVVLVCGDRERIVGVKPAAGSALRPAEYEISFTCREDHFRIGFADGRHVEMVAVEFTRAVEPFDFECEPIERRSHIRSALRAVINNRHRRAHSAPARGWDMPMKDTGRTDLVTIDRFDGGVGWLAHPDERMQRASHALSTDDGVWLVDPVDADGLDDLLAEEGDVAGVVILLDRHKRDAARLA